MTANENELQEKNSLQKELRDTTGQIKKDIEILKKESVSSEALSQLELQVLHLQFSINYLYM
jgi:hypothetical protein